MPERILLRRQMPEHTLEEEPQVFLHLKADQASVFYSLNLTQSLEEIKQRCPICLEGMTEDTASTLTCAHVFHGACIENVRKFALKKACSMCRAVLTTK